MEPKEFEQFMTHMRFETAKLAEIITLEEKQSDLGELLFGIAEFIEDIKYCMREENPCEKVKKSLEYLNEKWK